MAINYHNKNIFLFILRYKRGDNIKSGLIIDEDKQSRSKRQTPDTCSIAKAARFLEANSQIWFLQMEA